MKFLWVIGASFTLASAALAAPGSGGHAEDGVPLVVLFQTINVLIILGFGLFLGRKAIAQHFRARREKYLAAQNRAQSLLQKAEADYQELKGRLDKLKATRRECISKAKADATDLSHQILSDAKGLATKMNEEAKWSARVELEKARQQLKERLIREAFDLSRRDLTVKATAEDQRKLQEDFITKVQVVQ